MIRLSIIIPVFNALNYTRKCLAYLRETLAPVDQEVFQVKIVVTDDGSTDGTSEWIRQHYPEVELCHGHGNLWWSGGVNMGIKHAINTLHSDYVLLWNNDIRPEDNYFVNLFNCLRNNPPDNILGSKVYIENKTGKIISSMGGNFNPVTGKHLLIGFGQPVETFQDPGLTINWFPGMGTIFHRTVFDKVGFFDEEYFPQYKGDSDFTLRAHRAGYKMTLCSELEIWNDRENTGFSNDKSFYKFIQSLTSRKSNHNVYRDILFYQRHAMSILAYRELFAKYFKHIGGFFKWKCLGVFGITRKNKY